MSRQKESGNSNQHAPDKCQNISLRHYLARPIQVAGPHKAGNHGSGPAHKGDVND